MQPSVVDGTMLVSVVVPCYNVAAYVVRCLDSLAAQTYGNLEVVCINDGSTDDTLRIINDWRARHDMNVRLIDKRNEGLGQARWDGIAAANGNYICFLDSDDYVAPNYVEAMLDSAFKNDSDLVVCGFSRVDQETGRVLSAELCAPRDPFCVADDAGRLVEVNPAPWNKLFRATFLKELPQLPTPKPIEDIMVSWPAYVAMQGVVSFVPQALVCYSVRAGSQINSVTRDQLRNSLAGFTALRDFYCNSHASKDKLQALDATLFIHLVVSLNSRITQLGLGELRSSIRECEAYLDSVFTGWRRTPFLGLGYALSHKGNYLKAHLAYVAFRLRLLAPMLRAYSWVTDLIGKDVKW